MLRPVWFRARSKHWGKTCQREIEPGQPSDSFKCPGCKKSFKNEQGVGKHATSCPATQSQKKQRMAEEVNDNNKLGKMREETIAEGDATTCSSNSKHQTSKHHQKRMDDIKSAVVLVEASDNANSMSSSCSASRNSTTDNCKDNRGSSRRI